MLVRTESGPTLVVCSTCRLSPTERENACGRRGGELFADALERALEDHPCAERLRIERMPCLFACSRHCTVQIRCEGKMGYLLGGFSATGSDTGALLDYVHAYLASPEGIVPYLDWPEGVKGHFITRMPPEGFVWRRDDPPPVS